jgi:hypothetical protein
LGLLSSVIPIKVVFFLFSAGYDNSSHLGFLYRTWKIGSYEYGLQGNGKLVPSYSNLANAYPSLQMESWATILHTLNFTIESSEDLLRYFFFFSILSIMLLLYVLFSFVDSRLEHSLFVKLSISGFVLFSSISVIFWMGFPPTVWGIIFALLGLKVIISKGDNPIFQLLWASISYVVVLYSYQLFAPAFLVIYAYLFLNALALKKRSGYPLISTSLIIVAVPTLLLYRVSSQIKTNSFVYAQGGILMPSTWIIISFVFLTLLGFIYSSKKSIENKIICVAIVINALLTFYLLSSGIFFKQGTYYPIKSLYFTLFLLIAYIIWLPTDKQILNRIKLNRFRIATVFVLLGFSFLSLFSPNKGIWYGNTVDIIRSYKQLTNGSYPPFPSNCLNEVFRYATQPSNFDKQSNLLVIKVNAGQYGDMSDLVSRWANSLNGRIDENIIGLGMRLNADNDFNASILSFRKANPSENMLIQDSLTGCAKAN